MVDGGRVMIGRRSFLIIVFRLISQVLGLVGLFFISRYLPVNVYGSVAWTIASVSTFNSLADLGFGQAHIKRLSEGRDVDECVSTYAIVKLALTAAMAAVTVGSVLLWTVGLGYSLTDTSLVLVLCFVGYNVMYDIAGIITTTFDARMQTAKSQAIMIMDPLIRTPLVILVALQRMDALSLALAYLAGGMALLATALVFFFSEKHHFGKPVLLRSYWSYAAPLALTTVVIAVSSNLDKITVGFFGDSSQVAYLTSAQSILLMFGAISAAVSTLVFPAFSQMIHTGQMEEVKKKTHEGERLLSMVGLPIVVVLVFFPAATVKILLGSNFLPAADVIRILAIPMYLGMLNLTYATQISSLGRTDLVAKMTLLNLGMLVVLLLVLVPPRFLGIQMADLSYIGAAIASLTVTAISFVLVRMLVKDMTGTRSNPRILLHIVAAGLTGLVLTLLSTVFSVERWYDLMAYGLLSITFFVCFLMALREFSKADLRYFLEVVDPLKMLRYIRSEFKRE
jgi:O-antigen/teichoic acid export membrane protein